MAATKASRLDHHARPIEIGIAVVIESPPSISFASRANVTATGTNDAATCSEYLLVCQATSVELNQGSWHFTLETAAGELVLEAGDDEVGDLNQLTLLATVRGLEAIEGPASVTLLSTSRYLVRSLSESLPRWRQNKFVWEHFGRKMEVQHADLWRRVDRALSIHRVEACLLSSRLVSESVARSIPSPTGNTMNLRIDGGHSGPSSPSRSMRPKDQLRSWLLGNAAAASSVPTARQRFAAADFCD
jgi:ribonuclease HI